MNAVELELARRADAARKSAHHGRVVLQAAGHAGHVDLQVHATTGHHHQVGTAALAGVGLAEHMIAPALVAHHATCDQRHQFGVGRVGAGEGGVGVETQVAGCANGHIAAGDKVAWTGHPEVAKTHDHEVTGAGFHPGGPVKDFLVVAEVADGRVGEQSQVGPVPYLIARACESMPRPAEDAQIAIVGLQPGHAPFEVPAVARRRVVAGARGQAIEHGGRALVFVAHPVVAGGKAVELPGHAQAHRGVDRPRARDRVAVVVGGQAGVDHGVAVHRQSCRICAEPGNRLIAGTPVQAQRGVFGHRSDTLGFGVAAHRKDGFLAVIATRGDVACRQRGGEPVENSRVRGQSAV